MLRPLAAGARVALHHQDRLLAHRVLVDDRLVARGEPQGRHQHADGELGREILEVESLCVPKLLRCPPRDGPDRLGEPLEVAFHEGVLDEGAQTVVTRRIGGAERRAGAVRQLGHHVAAGRRIGPPVLAGGHDVGVARQDPHLSFGAPEAGRLVAQASVVWERIGVDDWRIGIELQHGRPPLAFFSGED